jgi:hypothetical protein
LVAILQRAGFLTQRLYLIAGRRTRRVARQVAGLQEFFGPDMLSAMPSRRLKLRMSAGVYAGYQSELRVALLREHRPR